MIIIYAQPQYLSPKILCYCTPQLNFQRDGKFYNGFLIAKHDHYTIIAVNPVYPAD